MENIIYFIILGGICSGLFFLFRIPVCPAYLKTEETSPSISIIIPARNEADNLPTLLSSLQAQYGIEYDITVVNDHSTDDTAMVAASHGAKVLNSEPLPDGWLGKPWACYQGAQNTTGDILLFLDADTSMELNGLSRLVGAWQHTKGAVSLIPYQILYKLHEQFSAFFNIIMAGSTNAFSLFNKFDQTKGLFGPCLLVSRRHYDIIDGHQPVKNKVLEHFFMAKYFRKHIIPISCYSGRKTLSTRMYPHNLNELAHGWGKAFAIGAQGSPSLPRLLISIWISAGVTIVFSLLIGGILWGKEFLTIVVLLYLVYVLQLYWMLRRLGMYSWYTCICFPIPLSFFIIFFSQSAYRLARGKGVIWKERTVNQ